MATSPERMPRWTRAEYDRLIDVGFFRPGEHVELLGGHLIVSEPHGTLHATAVGLVDDALRACFGPGWVVRGQMPVALDDESEPEPDVAVVPGARRDYLTDHPACPVLVVEVAELSLADDRGTKAALYALVCRSHRSRTPTVRSTSRRCFPLPAPTSDDAVPAQRLQLGRRHAQQLAEDLGVVLAEQR
jgi:Uma2 family endonuclease